MYIVKTATPSGWDVFKSTSVYDVYDKVLEVTDNDQKARRALEIVLDMGYGGQDDRVFPFLLSCER